MTRLALVTALLLASATGAQAQTRTWTIRNAVFSDGGTWTGSFDWDATTNTFGGYSWTVSGGDTTAFPAVTYTNANAAAAPFFADFQVGTEFVHNYVFQTTGLSPEQPRSLYLSTLAALTGAGGTVGLNLTSPSYPAVECYGCAPYRPLVSGYLTTAAGPGGVPEPASWALMIMGLGAVGGALRSRRRVRVAFA